MYESFEVANFRGIEALRLNALTRVNLITGLNDGGKTSLLEALFLHASGPLSGAVGMQALRAARGQDLAVNPSAGEVSPWDALFRNFQRDVPIHLKANTRQGEYALELRLDTPQATQSFASSPQYLGENRPGASAGLIIVEQRDRDRRVEYRQTFSLQLSSGPPGAGPTVSVETRLEPPASRPFALASMVKGQLGPDLAAGYSELRRRQGSVDLLTTMREVDDRIRALEVLVLEGRPQLHADLGTGALIPVSLLGDGVIAMARYMISLAQVRDGVLLVDEIGSGLHHSVLPRLWNGLHRAAERLNVQIFATTHSDEVVVAARDALAKRPNQLRLYRLRRRPGGGETDVASYGEQKLAAAVEMNAELR